jgi:hypothetical protein
LVPSVLEKKIKNIKYPFETFGPLVFSVYFQLTKDMICFLDDNPMNISSSLVPIGLVVLDEKIKNKQHPSYNHLASFFLLCTSTQQQNNFLEDHPMNIPAKFGSNWHSGFS